jgi:hypothetical protein
MKISFTELEKEVIKELIMRDLCALMPAESAAYYKLESIDWSDTAPANLFGSKNLSISYKVTADEESDGHDFYTLNYDEFVKIVSERRDDKIKKLLEV